MYISGSVGYTLLKHKYNNKYVLILADVHDGVSYCSQDSEMIDIFLGKSVNKNDILLEEVFREKLNLKELWPSAHHTRKLKELNINNNKIKPVDLRPMLLPFSWELSELSTDISDMPLIKYIEGIENLLNLKESKLFTTYILPEMRKLKDKEDFRVSLVTHFNEIKDIFNEYKTKYNKYLFEKVIVIYKTNQHILELINNMLSMIMEWFVVLCIHNSTNNTIVHMGLAHSERLIELLEEVYQFEIVSAEGINKMIDIIDDYPKSCIYIPSNNVDKFKQKYYLESW